MDNYYGYYSNTVPEGSNYLSHTSSTIFIGHSTFRDSTLMIPLTNGFYCDAIRMVTHILTRDVYIIAHDLGILFASEIYILASTLIKKYNKNVIIIGEKNKMLAEHFPDSFLNLIKESKDNKWTISAPFKSKELHNTFIEFTNIGKPDTIMENYYHDIYLHTNDKRYVFIHKMTEEKAAYYNSTSALYDELHMPYTPSQLYGGICFTEATRFNVSLRPKVVCNQIKSKDEFEYLKDHGIMIGKGIRI